MFLWHAIGGTDENLGSRMKTFLSIIDSYDEIMDFIFPPISFYDGFRVGAWDNSGKVGPNPRLVSIESRGNRGKPTPRINVCACVNLTCNSIANLMRICSERFRRLKMAVKRSDFIVRLYSQISSAKINMSF